MHRLVLLLTFFGFGCLGTSDATGPASDPDAPTALVYQLIPSGDPDNPSGVLLTWSAATSPSVSGYGVYGRASSAIWTLRGTTTGAAFTDSGMIQSAYYVASLNAGGGAIGWSDTVVVAQEAAPPEPDGFSSTSLNTAIQLAWTDNLAQEAGVQFTDYRVYTSPYDTVSSVCAAPWSLIGTTTSTGFLVTDLLNGVRRCFSVSGVTADGHESLRSQSIEDTPRYDGRDVVVWTSPGRPDSSSFEFFDSGTGRFGVVGPANSAGADLVVERVSSGAVTLVPGRPAVTLQLFSATPVADLTSIDVAPTAGYGSTPLVVSAGLAYVFQIVRADGAHVAAIHVTFVSSDHLILDWSYQSSANNVELTLGRIHP